MNPVTDRTEPEAADLPSPSMRRHPLRRLAGWTRWIEILGVGLSPAIVTLVLRLRLMSPADLPDPALHTVFVVDPADVYTRFEQVYATTARLREGARVGFLIPARLSYLAFGGVHGFFVWRYVLVLIAVVPVYLLLRRLYGIPAGIMGILVVLASPVLVVAWGTDYPDSAVVSYVAGGMACLAMPSAPGRRRWWVAAGGVLLTMAVWSHGVAVPLVAATMVAYLVVRLIRDRAGLIVDLALLAGTAAAVTLLLIGASAVVFGHDDFIKVTWQAYQYLQQPTQVASWHSSNWHWAPYVAYLLVPPAMLLALVAAIARRPRTVPTQALMIGLMAAIQLAVYAWLQFAGTVQTLEMHYFSSTLWAGVCLTFAITVGELARPLWPRPVARWLPPAVLLAVPLAYEADPHVPPFGWAKTGIIVGVIVVAAAMLARFGGWIRQPLAAATAIGLSLVALAGAALVLTVVPIPVHSKLPDTIYDPAPVYASALGGSGAIDIDRYKIATELPGFVGNAAYRGEELFMWWQVSRPVQFNEYAGIYHNWFNSLHSNLPVLTKRGMRKIRERKPAELLMFGNTAQPFPAALRDLAEFQPTVLRKGILSAGPVHIHLWLIRLGLYYHPPVAADGRGSHRAV